MFGNKIVTDEDKVKDILERGVDEVIEFEHLKARLLKGDKLRVKLGIDPTEEIKTISRFGPHSRFYYR